MSDKPYVATRGRFDQPQAERIVLEAETPLELHRLMEALPEEEQRGLVIEKRHEPGPPVILATTRSAAEWDALVEKGVEALGEWSSGTYNKVRAVLAAVWPDLAEEKRRAIESALIFAAAHDEDAARPVVDRDALAEAMYRHEFRETGAEDDWPDVVARGRLLKLADAVIAHLRVQDAADVRRALAEEIAADLDECGYYPAATRIRYRLAHGTDGNLGPAAPTARKAGGTP